MKNSIKIILVLAIGIFYGCYSHIEKKLEISLPQIEQYSELSALDGIPYVFYNEKDSDEIIYVVVSSHNMNVTHCIYANKTTDKPIPIQLMRMEYSKDIDMYLGIGKCAELGEEAMISIEGDFSKLGWNNGKLIKTFLSQE